MIVSLMKLFIGDGTHGRPHCHAVHAADEAHQGLRRRHKRVDQVFLGQDGRIACQDDTAIVRSCLQKEGPQKVHVERFQPAGIQPGFAPRLSSFIGRDVAMFR